MCSPPVLAVYLSWSQTDRSAVHAVLPSQARGGGSDLDICGDHCLVAGVQRAPGPDLLLQAGHH